MSLQEIFKNIRRNKHKRNYSIKLIADFMVTSKAKAIKIYEKEFE